MGAANVAEVSGQLRAAGREDETPAVIIENGSRPDQRAIASTLGALVADVGRLDLKSPTLLIIGEAAALADARTVAEILELAETHS
jgi:siroheme synthase